MAVPSRRFLSGGEIESGCLYVPKIGLMLELGKVATVCPNAGGSVILVNYLRSIRGL